jgi:Spy/CpxP family protein refolding chaperone
VNAWKVILATLVIFAAGFGAGAIVLKQSAPPPAAVRNIAASPRAPMPWQIQRAEFLRRMDKQLKLSSDQRQRIEKILKDSQERTRPLWDEIGPRLRAELKLTHDQIRTELTSEQRGKFEELLKPRRRPEDNSTEERRRRNSENPRRTATNAPGTNTPESSVPVK